MKLKNALIFSGLLALASCSNDSPNGPNEPNIPNITPNEKECKLVYPAINIIKEFNDGSPSKVVETVQGYDCGRENCVISFTLKSGEKLGTVYNCVPGEPYSYPRTIEPYSSEPDSWGAIVEFPAMAVCPDLQCNQR